MFSQIIVHIGFFVYVMENEAIPLGKSISRTDIEDNPDEYTIINLGIGYYQLGD